MKEINKTLSRNKKLALTGALSALDIVLVITNLGFIPISPIVSPTILHIPVILAATLMGLPEGLFVGGVFGITSLIKAAMSPAGALDFLFINPLCSVLPRLIIAVIAWGIWKLLDLIPKMPKILNVSITALITTVSHTLLVIGSIFLGFAMFPNSHEQYEAIKSILAGGYWSLIAVNTLNIVLECVSAIIVCCAVFAGIYISSNKKSKLSAEK